MLRNRRSRSACRRDRRSRRTRASPRPRARRRVLRTSSASGATTSVSRPTLRTRARCDRPSRRTRRRWRRRVPRRWRPTSPAVPTRRASDRVVRVQVPVVGTDVGDPGRDDRRRLHGTTRGRGPLLHQSRNTGRLDDRLLDETGAVGAVAESAPSHTRLNAPLNATTTNSAPAARAEVAARCACLLPQSIPGTLEVRYPGNNDAIRRVVTVSSVRERIAPLRLLGRRGARAGRTAAVSRAGTS